VDLLLVRKAREALAGALAAAQETGGSDAVAGEVASAVGALFELEQEGAQPKQASRLGKALGLLGGVAEALPRLPVGSAARTGIEAGVARARVLLEQAVRPPGAPPGPRRRQSSIPPPGSPPRNVETEVGFLTESNFFVGFENDLSDGGLFVSTYERMGVGTHVIVKFTLPDGHTVTARGEVVWGRLANEATPDAPPGVGVTLEGLTAVDMKSIRSFMAKRAPIFHPG
jgi:uncharacterized protein (TIGR02266 family)